MGTNFTPTWGSRPSYSMGEGSSITERSRTSVLRCTPLARAEAPTASCGSLPRPSSALFVYGPPDHRSSVSSGYELSIGGLHALIVIHYSETPEALIIKKK